MKSSISQSPSQARCQHSHRPRRRRNQAGLSRQSRLRHGPARSHRDETRSLCRARADRARPALPALGREHAKTTAERMRDAWRISPRSSCSGRISRTICSTSASPKPRAKRCADSATISTKSSRRRRSPASAMADWGGSRRVTWIRSRRSKCPRSATASATSSAFSIRSSATAGSARSPTNGCRTATRGRSRARRSPTR